MEAPHPPPPPKKKKKTEYYRGLYKYKRVFGAYYIL